MDIAEDKGRRVVRVPHTGVYLLEHSEPTAQQIAGRTIPPATPTELTLRQGEVLTLPGTGRLFARWRERRLSSPHSWA